MSVKETPIKKNILLLLKKTCIKSRNNEFDNCCVTKLLNKIEEEYLVTKNTLLIFSPFTLPST